MARSDSEQGKRSAPRLPSVEPAKPPNFQSGEVSQEELSVANEFFSSLDPEQFSFPVVAGSTELAGSPKLAGTAAPSKEMRSTSQAIVSDEQEIVAEIDAPLEQVWNDTLESTLGSELQQALPRPGAKVKRARPVRKARRARRPVEPGIAILERESEPFRWRDLFTRKGLKQNSSFIVSLVLHTFLLLFLSLLVVRGGIGDSTLFLDAIMAPDAPDEEMLEGFDINPVVFENDNEVEDEPLEALLDEAMEDEVSLEKQDQPKNQNTGSPQNQRAQGDGKSATFFGTKASGQRFVFVVDRSISMGYGSDNFVSRELFNRYDVAKSELLNAIESLQPHQEFFVLMFADNTVAMFQEKPVEQLKDFDFKMISATNQNKVRVQSWLDTVGLGPGTDPRLALEIAIDMDPDAIFMLSDGAFVSERMDNRPKTRDIIARHASMGTIVPINTVSLVVEQTIPTMQGIANKSRGLFRFTTIKDYVKQVANLRGPMRSRALEQLIEIENYSWEAREEVISDILLPMLAESSPVERQSAEALLHRATIGLFKGQVDSITDPGSNAVERWQEIVREIDGYHRTKQITALGQGREKQEKLLLAVLELEDDASIYELFETLDPDLLSTLTMVEMVRCIERAHLEFGASPESVGWLRWLTARLSGKKPKERSQLARIGWSVEQAQVSTNRLFEKRAEKARSMYRKYQDREKGLHLRQRIGQTIVDKYPETKEAGRVRLELAQARSLELPAVVADDDENEEIQNPYADVN